ncbi:HNH endonuclease signature motif containing protein [Nocardioides marinquilinus]|uniref:HNH endonuclease signature motif containing protein n=1 Tax=Nocardioides marinquilinus TaxID=1210400 RepID=A0ABP9PX87_9ACTN
MSLSAADVAAWVRDLGEVGAPDDRVDDAERVELLRALQELKGAASAAQARTAHRFAQSQRDEQRKAGVPAHRVGQGVAAQVGLAVRQSPARATRLLATAQVLCTEMPHTLAALSRGEIDSWRATVLVRETACLAREHRATIDEKVGGADDVGALGTKQLAAKAARLAARLDSAGVAARRRLAEEERRVTVRPAPDTMTYVTALLPVVQGVAMYAALDRVARQARATGDERTRGQVMADTLVELVTGRRTDVPPPVDLHLVMTDRALLASDDEPAVLPGYGLVPADAARDVVQRALTDAQVAVRRLFVAPTAGQLMAMESRSRLAPAGLAAFVRDRDQVCRTPWCGAPVRHVDHVEAFRDSGTTVASGLQGLCEACNYAKDAIGWATLPRPGPGHVTEITTPTGHVYLSFAPPAPGWGEDEVA